MKTTLRHIRNVLREALRDGKPDKGQLLYQVRSMISDSILEGSFGGARVVLLGVADGIQDAMDKSVGAATSDNRDRSRAIQAIRDLANNPMFNDV